MEDFFLEKVAIVTGAAQGIGKAIALALAQRGCHVCCLDVKEQENRSVVQTAQSYHNQQCLGITCDITDPQQVKEAFAEIVHMFTKVDILINNAAVFTTESFVKDSYEEAIDKYHQNMDTNCLGTFLCTKQAAPIMAKQRQGWIINVNTNHVKRHLFSVSKSEHAYDASKYAQLSLSASMAKELLPYGIRVNAICPASTRTPMLEGYFDPSQLPLTKQIIEQATHYASLLEPEEVAKAVCGMLQWSKEEPVGNAYLLMYSQDCEALAKGHIDCLAK